MKPKAYVLIVEDKSILYKRMAMFLKEHNYAVSDYTPSYESAIVAMSKTLPDIVLLDIELTTEKTGIDLGNTLTEEYQIPFIYVTDYDDDETFFKGIASQHEHYLVKTKPHLDTKQILRTIQTILSKRKNGSLQIKKEGILGFTDYVNKVKENGQDDVSKVPVLFEDIAKITTLSTEIDDEKTKASNKKHYKKLKPNYVRIETWNNKSYYSPNSLSDMLGKLPVKFVRINESEIINLSEHIINGRINGTRIKIGDSICHISKTYKQEVEKRFAMFYE